MTYAIAPMRATRQMISASRRANNEAIHFACDPASNQVCVVDGEGSLLEAFGEPGALPGQFNRPSDAIVVTPQFDGEDACGDHLALVAIADRGNHRVQVFEPEGQLVAIIGAPTHSAREATTVAANVSERDGWPFFRLTAQPHLIEPAGLRWDNPWLVVIDGEGRETRVDMAAALLPSFDEWLAAATTPMLAAAHHHFRHKARQPALAVALTAIETALGTAWLEAGDIEAVARLWSLSWAPQLDPAVQSRELTARDRATMRAAFRLGGAAAISRVRAAVRLSLGAFAVWPASEGYPSRRVTREAS